MAMTKEKRQEITKIILETYRLMDPSGINESYMDNKLSAMNDSEFDKYIKTLVNDDTKNFKLCMIPYKNDLKYKNIKKAADNLGVPLFEYVSMPFLNPDSDEVMMTQVKVPVGYLIIKKPQQMATKKNSMSIHAEKRSPLTGQVTAKDKNSRVSDMENIAITTLDNPELIKEFLSAKSDDMYAKSEVLKQIQNDGFVDMSKIETKPQNKIALNTMDVYFTACGLKTNLITDGLLLQRTLDNQNKRPDSISSNYNK